MFSEVMACSLSKLFKALPGPENCRGDLVKIGSIFENFAPFLCEKKCTSPSDPTNVPIQWLIINQLTPHVVEPSLLNAVDICSYHKASASLFD